MICAKCGANNPDASAYCGGCGALMAPGPDAPLAATSTSADVPTQRSAPEAPVAQFSQTPQPAPGEVFYSGSSQPQETPGFAGAGYPDQGSVPAAPQSWSSGAGYPAQAPQSSPSGAYPPMAVSGSEYPAGAYPATTPMPGGAYPGQQISGAYPVATPISGAAYPGQQVSGVYPGQPSQPTWGAYPDPTAASPTWGSYPGQVPPVAPQEPSTLIKPLPLWLFLLSILVVAAVLIVLVFLTGADWAAGAQTASVVALAVGGLILVAFGVRSALGMLAKTNMHRRSQIVSAILLALLLFAIAAVGLTQQSGIHTVQAHSLEGQQKWQVAINEYIDSGQHAPSSVDIARTYNEWGEQLAGQQQYTDSLGKFNTVIANYTQAGSELTRAQTGAASAYYNLAEQDMAAQKFSDAVTNFNQLTTNFSSSAYVQRAHADYAKALWGEAQPELTSACSSALTIYQQLSSQFSDTQDGQQAKAALALPQSVKGHFTSTIPNGANTPQVGLAQGVSASMGQAAFYAILDSSPVVTVQGDGTFTFPSIKQGSYYLVWGIANANGRDFLVGQRYPATVGPLCAFNFGDISENFPPAP